MSSTRSKKESAEIADHHRRSVSARPYSKRYFWLIVGYYLVTVYLRQVKADSNSPSPSSANPGHVSTGGPEFTDQIPSNDHDGAHHGGIQITKVDFEGVETPFIIALWIFCASLAKIGFHMAPKASHIFPESCLLIVVGVVIGFLLFYTQSVHVSTLTPTTFFHYMLPPIILDAGYFMPNRLFFNNLGTILLFAVVGTLWNTFAIGLSLWGLGQWDLFNVELPLLQTLLFSALISAVDPVAVLAVFEEIHVNEVLYIVVFGESLLNDAVTVVLYHMFEEYATMGAENVTTLEVVKGIASFPVVALGGTLIGITWGFLTGFITRFTNHVRVIEPIFIFVMAYLAYLCAETFHMSGILAVTFCGITMKNYVEANISHKSHTTVKYAMKMLSSSSETIIFMFLGVSTIHDAHVWNWSFIIATIVFCSVFRIIGTVVLSALANKFRLHKLGKVDQFVMSYGGLRGAVAFALVLLIKLDSVNCSEELRKIFVTTTIAVIYFTVFLQGITIKPLVQWLKVKRAQKRKPTMNERIHERLFDHTMAGMESLMGQVGHYNLRDKFKHFDNAYIRPCLIRDLKGAEPKILETFSKLTMRDAMDMMNRNPTNNSGKLHPDSVAAILRSNMNGQGGSSGNLEQLDQSTWNIDLQELEYNLSRKDMSDAKIHHLLAEELYKPSRRHRRLSYSRHAVHERDLSMEQQQPQVNYKTQMNFKRMVSEKALKSAKTRKTGAPMNGKDGNGLGSSSNGYVTYGEEYDNPVFTMSDERLQGKSSESHDGDGGIYFIAGGGSTGDFHRDWNERRWSQSSNSSVKSFMETAYPHVAQPIHRHGRRLSKQVDYDDSPTITEITLPWRRDVILNNPNPNNGNISSNHNPNSNNNQNNLNFHLSGLGLGRFRVSPARRMTIRDDDGFTSPTTMEMVPPWKREDEEEASIRQNEFPAWSANKEYLAYNSPTNTYLGGIDRNQQRIPTVIGLFKRDSISSTPGSRRGSIQSIHYHNRLDSPRHSIGSDGSGNGVGVVDSDNIILSNQQHTPQLLSRRGSTFVALPIPEMPEETDKDLMEVEKKEIGHGISAIKAMANTAEANKIEEGDDDDDDDDENGNPAFVAAAAAAAAAAASAVSPATDSNSSGGVSVVNTSNNSENKSNQTHTKL